MKLIRYYLIILITLLTVVCINNVLIMPIAGFSVDNLSDDEIQSFLLNVKISVLETEPSKKAIDCFDVDNGAIAIGYSVSNQKTICVYTNEGEFLYGFRFESDGSFGIELNENDLTIYFVRSDVAATINFSGEIVSIKKIKKTSENNAYWNDEVFSTERRIGDTKYILKNETGILNIIAPSYSQLLIIDSAGEISVFYDVSKSYNFEIAAIAIGGTLFVGIAVVLVITEIVKTNRRLQ